MKICFLKITLTAFLCLEDNGWLHYYQHGNAQHKLLLAKINWEESYRRLPLSPFFAPLPPQGGSPTLLSVGSHRCTLHQRSFSQIQTKHKSNSSPLLHPALPASRATLMGSDCTSHTNCTVQIQLGMTSPLPNL